MVKLSNLPAKEETKKAARGPHQQSRSDEYLAQDERKMVGGDMRPAPHVPPRNLPSLQPPQRQMSAANSPFAPPQQNKPDFNNIYEPFVAGSGYSAF